ncbi:MAG: PRC-barrel domain-containing protein [Pirellulaceae bacterium]
MGFPRWIAAASCAAILLTAAAALAEDKSAPRAAEGGAKAPDKRGAMTTDGIVRSSQVLGMSVQNADGKDLGAIEDVVVDMKTGKVRYAALSFGGFLGFGEKLFAVPWEALNIKTMRNDSDAISRVVLYNVTQKELENAPGFPSDKWPNFADAKFTAGIDRYYEKDGEKRDSTKPGAKRRSESGDYDAVFRASEVEGMAVYNRENKQLGSISELVFDLNRGKVRYAAMSYGGFLGVGDKLFAVPASKISVVRKDNENRLVMNIEIETLKNAEGFDQSHWPNTADPRWSAGIDEHYGVMKKSSTGSKTRPDKE